MAMRLRQVNGVWIALCAAKYGKRSNDVYLDDGQHQAITEKYLRDWKKNGLISLPRDDVDTDGQSDS